MSEDFSSIYTCDVVVVGGGTSGLSVASELKRLSVENVIVIEREIEAGGIPRHCGHYPFGLREYSRLLKGPQYAEKNVNKAINLGVDIWTGTTVTKIRPNATLELLRNGQRILIKANRVVLATGARESSRSQRLIGGDRPEGIIATGALQSMVYLQKFKPFNNPVIIGSELVSFSAFQTCAHLGIKPVAIIEEESRLRVRKIFHPYLFIKRVPVYLAAKNLKVNGDSRVESISFSSLSGDVVNIKTDGVIISGRFKAETQIVLSSHLKIDAGSGGPVVDQLGRCTDVSFYATGNILGQAESSGYCWEQGIETAKRIKDDLLGKFKKSTSVSKVICNDPAVKFVIPQQLSAPYENNSFRHFYVGLSKAINHQITLRTDKSMLWEGRVKAKPLRRLKIPIPEL